MFTTIILCVLGIALIALGAYLWYRRQLNDESSFGHDDVRWEQMEDEDNAPSTFSAYSAPRRQDTEQPEVLDTAIDSASRVDDSQQGFVSDDIDESLDEELDQLGRLLREPDDVLDSAQEPETFDESTEISADSGKAQSTLTDNPEMVVSVHVMAKSGLEFHGDQLLQVFDQVGLQHGDRDIFHHYDAEVEGAPIRFSAANMHEPGTFDLDAMQQVKTPGVTLFMLLPGENNTVQTFENLLDTGEKIAKKLGGELRDSQRSVLTAQGTNLMKESIHQFYSRRKVDPEGTLKQGQLNF